MVLPTQKYSFRMRRIKNICNHVFIFILKYLHLFFLIKAKYLRHPANTDYDPNLLFPSPSIVDLYGPLDLYLVLSLVHFLPSSFALFLFFVFCSSFPFMSPPPAPLLLAPLFFLIISITFFALNYCIDTSFVVGSYLGT